MIENVVVLVRCAIAFASFMAYLVALDWVISRVLGRENSQFFRR